MARWTTRNACGISCNDTSTPCAKRSAPASACWRNSTEPWRRSPTGGSATCMHESSNVPPSAWWAWNTSAAPRRHHRPALGTLHPARARDRRQARSRGLLWHLRAAAQRRIPLRRRLRGAGGLAGAGGHGALPGAGAEVRGVHPQGHGAADRRELPGDLQPPARRTRPGAQGGVDFEYYDQRFRGPLDPNSQVDLYIPIY